MYKFSIPPSLFTTFSEFRVDFLLALLQFTLPRKTEGKLIALVKDVMRKSINLELSARPGSLYNNARLSTDKNFPTYTELYESAECKFWYFYSLGIHKLCQESKYYYEKAVRGEIQMAMYWCVHVFT